MDGVIAGYAGGFVMHVPGLTGALLPFLPTLLRALLFGLGVITFTVVLTSKLSPVDRKLLVVLLMSVIVFSFSIRAGERYFLTMLPLLILLFVPQIRGDKRWAFVWLLLTALGAAVYYSSWILFPGISGRVFP